jgi:pimeloyl-ACP methyl ester carboxylesterase
MGVRKRADRTGPAALTLRGIIMRKAQSRSPFQSRSIAVAVAVTTLAGLGVTACESSSAAAEVTAGSAKTAIVWGSCPPQAEGAAKRDPREQCGTLQVPLNYRDPKSRTIAVAVSRLSTAKPGQHREALVLNPGGPALPGLDMPSTMAPTLPAAVLKRYDLIGFDPRGVEHSTAQTCGIASPSPTGLLPYPAADGSITASVAYAKASAQQCLTTAGPDLRYFTTDNTARDLDRIRQGLGQKKLSYWGQSYGTYLGAVYATLFKDRVGRMILEGNVDPAKVWQGSAASWGKGMAERFPDAARVAAAQNGTLQLGATVPAVTKTYLALADRLDRTPAALPGTSVSLGGPMLRAVTYSLLLHNETLPVLTQFWKAAADLAAGKLSPADTAVLTQVFADSPATPGVPADNQMAIFLALTCGDASWSKSIDGYAARTAADRKAWPLTAGMPANITACAFWPAPLEAPVTVTGRGQRNILILQNRRDNATPWDGALGLRRELGRRAAFVGVDNGGHYVYNEGSACADRATTGFLTGGKLPKKDLYCTDVATK